MAVQIQISDETWKQLKDMRKRPSDTFNEIIKKLITRRFTKKKEVEK